MPSYEVFILVFVIISFEFPFFLYEGKKNFFWIKGIIKLRSKLFTRLFFEDFNFFFVFNLYYMSYIMQLFIFFSL